MTTKATTASASRNRVPRLPRAVALRWSVGLSVLLTVLFIAVLSVRMAAGADPALAPKIVHQSAATTTQSTPTQSLPAQVPTETAPAPVQPAPVQTSTS
jgi:hypothetical protein